MADLESQIRALADRRLARTSPVEFTGESRLPLDHRSHDVETPINWTEITVPQDETARPRRTWYVLGAAAALVAIAVVGIAFVAGDDDPVPQTDSSVEAPAAQPDSTVEAPAAQTDSSVQAPAAQPDSSANSVEVAMAFWEALAAGDRDAALGLVSPQVVDTGAVSPFGRANTLERQFDWYEAVGWQWTLQECVMRDNGVVECTATGSNRWSDALGVEPVTGGFVVQFDEDGIVSVGNSAGTSFDGQWVPMVFDVFADWVEANHPEDAMVMFNFGDDVDSEILDLYEVNTERFVEAQRGE